MEVPVIVKKLNCELLEAITSAVTMTESPEVTRTSSVATRTVLASLLTEYPGISISRRV